MTAVSSSQLRFMTVRDLYNAFPTAAVDVGVAACDEPSLSFARNLAAAGDIRAALSYCAYLIGRREAVWWGCRCVRQSELRGAEARCIDAAESWVREPDDAHRRRALDIGSQSSRDAPATWLALGAAWSGGSISESEGYRITPPQQLTAQAVRGALLLARARLPRDRSVALETGWVEAGLRYAAGDLQHA